MLVIHLGKILLQRIVDFLDHWYRHSFFLVWEKLLNSLAELDKTFALKITIRNWGKPLYQDYSFLGYLLGFIARTGRIAVASLLYIFILILFMSAYAAWALLPFFILYRGFVNPKIL